ncbi:MAG: DoxX family protein [Gemmatimonas sp.]
MRPQPYAVVAGRILLSLIFLVSGVGKLADPSGTIQSIAAAGLPLPAAAYAVAVLCELGGGLAVLVGYHARLAAAIMAAFTIAAALMFHNDLADPDQMVHFLKNLAIAGGFLCIVAFGAGALSLDELSLERRARRAVAR